MIGGVGVTAVAALPAALTLVGVAALPTAITSAAAVCSGSVGLTASVATTVAGLWGVGRGVSSIVDKEEHDQSISPFYSVENGVLWISVVGGFAS